jgi:hypothetical protein
LLVIIVQGRVDSGDEDSDDGDFKLGDEGSCSSDDDDDAKWVSLSLTSMFEYV